MSRAAAASGSSTPRARRCSTPSTARCSGWGSTPSTCGRCTPGATTPPLEETLAARSTRRSRRAGPLRRGVELLRLADRTGGHLAAGLARPGAARVDPDGVLAAAARHRARGAARRDRARAGACSWSPLGAGVLTGKYRGGTPADSRAASPHFAGFIEHRLNDRSRRIVDAVATAADGLEVPPLAVALAWVRDAPGVTAPVVGARTAAQLRGSLQADRVTLPAEIRTALDEVRPADRLPRRLTVRLMTPPPPVRGKRDDPRVPRTSARSLGHNGRDGGVGVPAPLPAARHEPRRCTAAADRPRGVRPLGARPAAALRRRQPPDRCCAAR